MKKQHPQRHWEGSERGAGLQSDFLRELWGRQHASLPTLVPTLMKNLGKPSSGLAAAIRPSSGSSSTTKATGCPASSSCECPRRTDSLFSLQSFPLRQTFCIEKIQPTWFLFFYYWHQLGLYEALMSCTEGQRKRMRKRTQEGKGAAVRICNKNSS